MLLHDHRFSAHHITSLPWVLCVFFLYLSWFCCRMHIFDHVIAQVTIARSRRPTPSAARAVCTRTSSAAGAARTAPSASTATATWIPSYCTMTPRVHKVLSRARLIFVFGWCSYCKLHVLHLRCTACFGSHAGACKSVSSFTQPWMFCVFAWLNVRNLVYFCLMDTQRYRPTGMEG